MNELTVMSDFAAKVKEKIKRDFAGMIPDDAWDKLVTDAVATFIKNELGGLVRAELTEEVKGRLRAMFQEEGWRQQWDGRGKETAGEKVKELIRENIPLIVETALQGAMQNVVNDLHYRLSQR